MSPSSNPASALLPQKLQHLLQNGTDADFNAAVNSEAVQRARQFVAGVKAYRHHPARRSVPDMPVIWQEGTTHIHDYNAANPGAPVVLVIPSLINRFDILDLDFAPSFLRLMAAEGFRPLVVDWDEPGQEEQRFTLNDYSARLVAILDGITTNENPASVHVLGYCMGGMLALALATLRPERVKTLTLLATPWDFHKPDPANGVLMAELVESWCANFDAPGQMPVDIIQYLFAFLQPFQSVSKFVDFAALDPDSLEARHFVLLEDWLNQGVPLPLPVARECLKGWYGENTPAAFTWRVGNRSEARIVDPRTLTMPAYLVVPGRDHIVPPESALPLAKLLPHASLHEPMAGHIGMMASRNAQNQVWKPLLHWLKQHA